MYERLGPVAEQVAPHVGLHINGKNVSKARVTHDFWTIVLAQWPTSELVDGSLRRAGLYLAENEKL